MGNPEISFTIEKIYPETTHRGHTKEGQVQFNINTNEKLSDSFDPDLFALVDKHVTNPEGIMGWHYKCPKCRHVIPSGITGLSEHANECGIGADDYIKCRVIEWI